jgi:D-3-phosphoglycerate dehydrogenase
MQPTPRADALIGTVRTALESFRQLSEAEPVFNASDPLLQLPNCLCTPHLGFVEKDNYEAYFGIAFDNINAYAAGSPQNLVV